MSLGIYASEKSIHKCRIHWNTLLRWNGRTREGDILQERERMKRKREYVGV
jgi:hypothetical protein